VSLLQKLISERVSGYWPQWLLDDIKKEGDKEKYGERLIRYYYTFYNRLPSILVDDKKSSTIGATPLFDEIWPSPVRAHQLIGDHVVAYYDTKSLRINVYDLKENKILNESQVPNLPFDPSSYHIEKLSNNLFVLMRSVGLPAPNADLQGLGFQFTVWRWSAATSGNPGSTSTLELLHTRDLPLQFFPAGFLGISGQGFVTWRKQYSERQFAHAELKTVDYWGNDGTLLKSVRLTSKQDGLYPSNFDRSVGRETEVITVRSKLVKTLSYLKENGIEIAPENFSSALLPIFGRQVDQKTRMIIDKGVKVLSLDYKILVDSAQIDDENRKHWNSDFNNSGDIIVNIKKGDYSKLFYVNIWQALKRVAADSERCVP
jgi:hypothetical protein